MSTSPKPLTDDAFGYKFFIIDDERVIADLVEVYLKNRRQSYGRIYLHLWFYGESGDKMKIKLVNDYLFDGTKC